MKMYFPLLTVLTVLIFTSSVDATLQKFYIGGLFPSDVADLQDRLRLGVYPEMAARLAVRQINEDGLLSAHNVSLEMLSFGTSCDQDAAVYAYLQLKAKISKTARYMPLLANIYVPRLLKADLQFTGP